MSWDKKCCKNWDSMSQQELRQHQMRQIYLNWGKLKSVETKVVNLENKRNETIGIKMGPNETKRDKFTLSYIKSS